MKYDFDRIIDRRRPDAVKWAVGEHELPMWVADMDYAAAPEIIAALSDRLAHGVFGYGDVPEEWYSAYRSWWSARHGFDIKREWLIFCTGVIPAMSSTVRKLCTPNENVLIQTPVYNHFFSSIVNNGCRALESPLICENGEWRMDFDDIRRKMADPQTTMMILCNPHNPVGRIWTREELAKVGELAERYHVTVISDEIHCDITAPGREYVPFASVSDTCRRVSVNCIAPTKTFNIAGLQTAAVCVPDENLRNKVRRALNTDEVAEPNSFACWAAVAAFNEGGPWLDAMREYVFENRRFAEKYIAEKTPRITFTKADATYLMWLDISGLEGGIGDGVRDEDRARDLSADFARYARRQTGLFVTAGSIYGTKGENYLRLNLACPRSVLKDGMDRLRQSADDYMAGRPVCNR